MTTKTFNDLGVRDDLVATLKEQGIVEPFPIQELTIPLALAGNDLIGQARTGTGKTLAFGLPLLEAMRPQAEHVQALVITPTRELCLQVAEDIENAGRSAGVRVVTVYGGVAFGPQIGPLRDGAADVVVGTPGRLLDLFRRGDLVLDRVGVLVLDEADRMLDMGFLPDVSQLIDACDTDRQTLLFSATMPNEVVALARQYMRSPTFIRADAEELEIGPETAQHFFVVHRMDKPRIVARILQSPHAQLAAVFVRTKRTADRLVDDLGQLGVKATPIHGDLHQSQRERNLERFRAGKQEVLVATEVAARGLDIEGISHVINYDCPDDEKMYLHRIGRTGRAGAAGVAVTFAQHDEVEKLSVIRKRLGLGEEHVHEVFSTSPVLAELFDLPDETPWDKFVTADADTKASSGRKRARGGGRKSRSRPAKSSESRQDSRERDAEAGAERVRTRTRDVKETAAPQRQRARSADRGEPGRAASEPASKKPARADATNGEPASSSVADETETGRATTSRRVKVEHIP